MKNREESGTKERENGRHGYFPAVQLAAVFCAVLLCGCTARELESRRFPLVLQVGSEDGRIVFACGWPEAGEGNQEEKTEGEEKQEEKAEGEGEREEKTAGEEKQEEKTEGEGEREEKTEGEEKQEEKAEGEGEREEKTAGEGKQEEKTEGKDEREEKAVGDGAGEAAGEETEKENIEDSAIAEQGTDVPEDIAEQDNITRVKADSVEEAVNGIQRLQDKYVDYSQVKAILWENSLDPDSRLGQELLEWMENNPAFARNSLVFPAGADGLTLEQVQSRANGQPGSYLENLYKNNEDYKKSVRTLEEMLYSREQ